MVMARRSKGYKVTYNLGKIVKPSLSEAGVYKEERVTFPRVFKTRKEANALASHYMKCAKVKVTPVGVSKKKKSSRKSESFFDFL